MFFWAKYLEEIHVSRYKNSLTVNKESSNGLSIGFDCRLFNFFSQIKCQIFILSSKVTPEQLLIISFSINGVMIGSFPCLNSS